MGFGLFVPQFRAQFSMSASTVGFVSGIGFLGFFLGLVAAQALRTRRGPDAPVLTGLACAATGMAIVSLAPGVGALAFGVFLAAASAGFAWTPFNDAVHRKVHDTDRPSALSRISTGTSVGVILTGVAALAIVLTGLSWRYCWGFFALASVAALVGNRVALHPVGKSPARGPGPGWRVMMRAASIPLFAVSFVFGTVSAIYISFAGDHMRAVGGLPGLAAALAPGVVFILYGLFGLSGLLAGRVKDRVGLACILRLLIGAGALSLALMAVAPSSWAGLIASAGLQGVHVMMTSAVLAFWSERLFPAFPSLSFTATLLAMAAGSIIGPALAGVASDVFGVPAMFLGAAVLPAMTILLLRNRYLWDRPLQASSEA